MAFAWASFFFPSLDAPGLKRVGFGFGSALDQAMYFHYLGIEASAVKGGVGERMREASLSSDLATHRFNPPSLGVEQEPGGDCSPAFPGTSQPDVGKRSSSASQVVCLALGCEELTARLFSSAFVEAVEVTASVESVGRGRRTFAGGVECI